MAGTGASAFTATVDGGPTLQFNAVTSLQINAQDGNDDVALTVGTLAITAINVSGGAPTASDKLVVVGTPARRHGRVYAYLSQRRFADWARISS